MAQITTGVRSIFNAPSVYDSFQNLVGANKLRERYVKAFVQPSSASKILDIGCGTGEMLDFLPEGVEYFGFDMSAEYINAAVARYGQRGSWHCDSVSDMDISDYGTFDIVMANGVLHHLEDDEGIELVKTAVKALKQSGRFCSFDGCYIQDQNPIARYLISKDRGLNVRRSEDYVDLVKPFFDKVELTIRHDLLRIPYTHAVIVATSPHS